LLGAALATGVYRLLHTPETGPELEPIPDIEEASMDEEFEDEIEDEEELDEQPAQQKPSM
jgi:hypothetical protein